MKRLWGRKVSDLSFSSFLEILTFVANKQDKVIHFLDRYYPNFKTCACCGYVNQELNLKDREWDCLECNTKDIPRDLMQRLIF